MEAFSLHHLKIFACAVKNGSLARAAEELLLSQSTLSIHLKNLENYFGVKLLERQGRTIKPTFAGAILYKAAQEALTNLNEAKNQIQDITRGSAGYLSVGIPSPLGTYVLPEIIKNFRKQYPGVELSIQLDGVRNIEESVWKGRIELGITMGRKKTERLDFTRVLYFMDQIVFVTSTQSGPGLFRQKEILEPQDVENQTLTTRKPGSSTRNQIMGDLKKYGVSFRQIISKDNLEQIKEDVLNTKHIAAISRFIVQEEIEKGLLCLLNIANLKITRPVCFIHRKEQNLSLLAANFIELCKKHLPSYLDPLAPAP